MSADLANRYFSPDANVRVIVQFRSPAMGAAHRRVLGRGGALNRDLDLVRAKAYTVPAEQIDRLADDPDVEFVSPDRPLAASTFGGTPDYGWMTVTGLSSMTGSLPYDGAGIGIAVLDSGLAESPDLRSAQGRSRIVFSRSFVPGDSRTIDAYGHGMHVAGIVAGNGSQSGGPHALYAIRGVAPNANLINLRVLDSRGQATDSTVIAAIQSAIQMKNTYNIRVLNLSLGRGVFSSYQSDPLCQAVEQAWRAGIVVVVSAGNEGRNNSAGTQGYGTITAPGNDPLVITVGAMNTGGTASRTDDKITSYSSKGPTVFDQVIKPDLVAPGNRILSLEANGSALVQTYPANQVPLTVYTTLGAKGTPAYFQLSGTSMAAPMVSGAAAVLLQKNPSLTPDQVKAILMRTASKFPATTSVAIDPATGFQYVSQYDVFTVGAGYLDLNAALANRDVPAGTALSPVAAFDGLSGNMHMVSASGAVWYASVVWGANAVWGNSVLLGSSVIWGGAIDWSAGVIGQSRSVVWGTGGVTGNSVALGDGNTVGSEAAAIAINGEY